MTAADLKRTLQRLGLRQMEVRVGGTPGRLVAVVASTDFLGQDPAQRQRIVWQHLLDSLSDEDTNEIEFVFTYTPEQLAALDRQSA